MSPIDKFCGLDAVSNLMRAASRFAIGDAPNVGATGLRDGVKSPPGRFTADGSSIGPWDVATGSAAMFISYAFRLDERLSGAVQRCACKNT